MEDSVSQYQGYDAGEIDFATYVANEGYTNYKGKDDLYRVDPYVSNYFIDINSLSTENKALQDVNVRKAMAMAVDPVSYTHLDVYKRQTLDGGFPVTTQKSEMEIFYNTANLYQVFLNGGIADINVICYIIKICFL